MTTNEWLTFEEAVASFLRAIGGNARVTHDTRLADKDTGRPRQRDVWIEAKLFNLFDVKALVSCKMWARKVDSQDMDAFIGEMISCGAQKGVMYADGGFTGPALEKAKAKGISCCKLYRNESVDIPEVLIFPYYCCAPRVKIGVSKELAAGMGERTFQDLFDDQIGSGSGSHTLLDELVEAYDAGEQESVKAALQGNGLPKAWRKAISFAVEGNDRPEQRMSIAINGTWMIYKSRIEGHLVDGTYAFTEKTFVGTVRSPAIKIWGTEPGPGWEVLAEVPEELESCHGVIVMQGDARKTLKESWGELKIGDIEGTKASELAIQNEDKKGLTKRDE